MGTTGNEQKQEPTREAVQNYVERLMEQDGIDRANLSPSAQDALKELPGPEAIQSYRDGMEQLHEAEKVIAPMAPPDQPELLDLYPVPEFINEQGQKEQMELPELVPNEADLSIEKEKVEQQEIEAIEQMPQTDQVDVMPNYIMNEADLGVPENVPEELVEPVEPVSEPEPEIATESPSHEESRSLETTSDSGGD